MEDKEKEQAKRRRPRRRCCFSCTFTLILLLLLWAVPIFIPDFYPWSDFLSQDQYFDVNSGRHRNVNHLLYVAVSDRTSEGPLAGLYREYYSEYPEPSWQIVNSFSYWSPNISPHYFYHGMFSVERKLKEFLDAHECTDGFKRLLVAEILWSAKVGGEEGPVSFMMYELEEKFRGEASGQPLTEDMFPPDSSFFMVSHLVAENPKMIPRAYGLDRFPELMQKIPPPH